MNEQIPTPTTAQKRGLLTKASLAKQRTNAHFALHERLDRHVPTWRFAGRDGAWHTTLTQVIWFMQEHGRRPNKSAEPGSDEAKLVAWVKDQQTAIRGKRTGRAVGRKITAEQVNLLAEVLPTVFATPA